MSDSEFDRLLRAVIRDELAKFMVTPHPGVILATSHNATIDALNADIRTTADRLPCGDTALGLGFSGWTYVLQVGIGPSACFKIGKSIEVSARIRDIQMATPYRLRVARLIHSDQYERHLHMKFHAERMHGEWFHGPAVTEWALRDDGAYQCEGCSWREQP